MSRILASSARLVCRRQIHHTAPAGAIGWLGGLFKDKAEPEVVTETKAPEEPKPPAIPIAPLSAPDVSPKKTKTWSKDKPLEPPNKRERFEENIEFMTPRLGRRPQIRRPMISKLTWVRTLAVCQNEEELRQVIELFPLWKESSRRFNYQVSEAFIARCIKLDKPNVAIEVFGNYAKYSVPLSIAGARNLLRATFDTHPLIIPVTISSLFKNYNLPSISADLASCSMLLSACLDDGSENAMAIARNLTATLKLTLKEEQPLPIPTNLREKGDNMHIIWLSWALRKIEDKLSERAGADVEWLHSWRVRSGYIEAPEVQEEQV